MIQETFVMIKPDGVRRGLVGEIITRFERKSMKIVDMKMLTLSRGQAEALYEMHKGKDFFGELIDFTTSGPVVLMKIQGEEAIRNCRMIVGETIPEKRLHGSIRGDYSPYLTENIIHASSSEEDAKIECRLFFDI